MGDIGLGGDTQAEKAFQAYCEKRLLPLRAEEKEYQKKIAWQEYKLNHTYEISSHWWFFLLGALAGFPLIFGLYFVEYLQFVAKTIIQVSETGQGSIFAPTNLADYPGALLVFGMMSISFAIGIALKRYRDLCKKMEKENPGALKRSLEKLKRKSEQQKALIKEKEEKLQTQKEDFLKRCEKKAKSNTSRVAFSYIKKVNDVLANTPVFRFIEKKFLATSPLEVYTYGVLLCFILASIVINAIGYVSFIQNGGYDITLNANLATNQMWGKIFSVASFSIIFEEPYLSILLAFVCAVFTLCLLRFYTIGEKKQKIGLSVVLIATSLVALGLSMVFRNAPFLVFIDLAELIGVIGCCKYPETRRFAKRILEGVLFSFFGIGAIFLVMEYFLWVIVLIADIVLVYVLLKIVNAIWCFLARYFGGSSQATAGSSYTPTSSPKGSASSKKEEKPSSGKRQIVIGVNGMVFRGETAVSGKALFSCNKNNPSAMAANRLCSQAEYDRGEVKILKETMFSGTEEVTSIASSPPRGAFPLAAKWL